MNPAEAAVLLAAISANDNREVTEAGARAWAAALPDVTLQDALTTLPAFYRAATRNTKNWIFPGDVVAAVVDLHDQQRQDAGERARIEVKQRRAIEAGDLDDELDAFRTNRDTDLAAMRARYEAVRDFNAEHLPNCLACTQAVQRAQAESKRKNVESWG